MKKNSALLLVLLAFTGMLMSCSKSADYKFSNGVSGKWKMKSRYVSPGGGGQWQNLSVDQMVQLEFKMDGTLVGDDLATKYGSYVLKDSVTLTLKERRSDITQNFRYSLKNDTLTLSPAGPMFCTEGCAAKYVRM